MILANHHTRVSAWIFLGMLFSVYSAAWFVVGQLSTMEDAGFVALGLTCDIVILVPLVFYLLFVRRLGHSLVRVVPVVVASMVVASVVIPSGHQKALHVLEAIVAPAEVGVLGWVIWRASKALRSARNRTELDPVEQFRVAAFGLFRNHRVAGVFATEISIFYYGLCSWKFKPHCTFGASEFKYHIRSGQAGVVLGFVLILAIEGLAVHLLLSMWSALAAWLFTFSTVYAALWLISDFRASVLRPMLVCSERVLIRSGIRYTVEISRANIIGVSREKPDIGKEALSFKLMGAPSHWIILSETVEVQASYGMTKRVRAIGIEPDDPQMFEQALANRFCN